MKGNLCIGRLVSETFSLLKRSLLFIAVLFAHTLFSQAPTITSFSPTSAAKGNNVIITGTNLTGTIAVSFSGVAASSFTVVSSTQINAVVPSTTNGTISITTPVQTVSLPNFYYIPLSGIITDFEGYWPTTTVNNNTVLPDNSHNLLAFIYNGITYSTGVNNSTLTGQGIAYTPGNFRSLPVANIAGVNPMTNASILLAMGTKVDGNAIVANASTVANLTIRDVMTDGINGLNLGTGITNLPVTANMSFDIHIINLAKISDAEPDILITQIADPSKIGNDIFQFVDAAGLTIGNPINQDMSTVTPLGTYKLDLFTLSPGAPFNSAMGYGVSVAPTGTNTTRNIRIVGFKLSDFGITAANYLQVAALKITPSGTSDYAFIAYSDAIILSPNIDQNLEKTNSLICSGGTANLEVITSAAYGGTLVYTWKVSADAGSTWSTVINTANYSGATTKRLTITAAINNYKYKATVTESGTNYSATSSPFTIGVITPTPPTGVTVAATTTTCLNNLISLSSAVNGGSNYFYQWQTNTSGTFVDITDAILSTYLPPVNVTGVVSYKLNVSSGSGCSGGVTSAPAIITVVGISSAISASRCGTGVVSLTASATSGTITWYTASNGGQVITTGTTYSPSISATTTYYVATDAGQCSNAGRVPVTATINSIVWAGTNTTEWSTLANWDCGGVPPSLVPSATNNVTIPSVPTGRRFPTITTVAPINNITISTAASIIVESTGVFEIYGAISNAGIFTATTGTISMRGAALQTIPANTFSTNTIKNLTINNTAGVLLGGALNLTGTYTPTAGVLTTFGYLTLKSDSNGTAKVAPGSGIYINGNVNVERYMPQKRSWRMMTTPLSNSNTIFQSWQNGGVYEQGKGLLVTAPGGGTGIDAAGNSSMKTWNVITQSLKAVTNTQVPISATNNGSADNTPYFIFVRGDREWANIDPNGIRRNITTLTSTGYLQTGIQNFNGLSAVAGGFSMVGNPYASPIDWNLALRNAGTKNIKRKFYVWDPKFNSVGGYTAMDDVLTPGVFSPTPTSSSQNNFIQSSQAVFVITDVTGSAAVQIIETNKSSGNNTAIFGRPMGNSSSFITDLLLIDSNDSSTVLADGSRADFNTAFAAGVDDDDNVKCYNVNETFGFTRNNVFLATERRPSIVKKDTLFFKLIQSSKRKYQFKFNGFGFSDPTLTAILEDSYTGLPILLSLNGITAVDFSINADAGSQVANRFRMVFSKLSVLPVTFTGIKAFRQNDNIAVEWQVENELNISKYEVQRSADGQAFNKINTIAASAGILGGAYNYLDLQVSNIDNFYRIKSIGADGNAQYTKIVKVRMDQNEPSMNVYPNPVEGKTLSVQFNNQPEGAYTIKIFSTGGQLLMTRKIDHAGGTDTKNISLPVTIKTGGYQLSIVGNDLIKTSIKVVVK